MICRNCGSMLPDGVERCSVCGAVFTTVSTVNNVARGTYVRTAPQYDEGFSGVTGDYRKMDDVPVAPKKDHVSVGGWIARWLLGCIPIVGWLIYFIMLIVWANNDSYEDSFRNWAKAQLWIILIIVALVLIVCLIIFGFASSLSSPSYYYY